MIAKEANHSSEWLVAKYGIQVPIEIASSIFMGRPKVAVLLSRAAFRPNVDSRTAREQGTQLQRGRRKFLYTMLGLAAVSIAGLWLLNLSSTASPQPNPSNSQPSSVSPQSSSSSSPQPVTTSPSSPYGGQLLANATNIPSNQSLTFNDPTVGPIVLIHLDNGQFVAYSSICTHAGCQVQFDPSARDIACPCHGAVYDPYNNAQVLSGPAPYPLQKIPIRYDPSTGNIYLTS